MLLIIQALMNSRLRGNDSKTHYQTALKTVTGNYKFCTVVLLVVVQEYCAILT